jgi:hypothetical protein
MVPYSVTDSDGNRADGARVVLVGNWIVQDGYAINASDFTKRAGQVRGTEAEMVTEARARAIGIDPAGPNYGRQVTVVVQDDGGYSDRRAGTFRIRFGVQAAPGAATTITATVTSGNAPALTVPATKTVPEGAGVNYMTGVSATDDEDGNITAKVIHNTPVNSGSPGAYKVTYSVTDSDGNTTTAYGVVLVGTGWVVRGGYALYAQDFARRLSAITGTAREAIRLSKAMAVWIADTSSVEFGKYVEVSVADKDGYRKAAGVYNIKFAVSERTSVTKTIRASISDDTPKTPTVKTTTTPAPDVTITTPAAPAPVIVETQPAPVVMETPPTPTAEPVTEAPATIEPTDTPLAAPAPETGKWHLIDLLLVIITLVLGFFLMMYAIRRRDEYADPDETKERQIRMWGQLGILLGIVSIIVLLLTQDFSGTRALVDAWTILFAVVTGVEALAVIGVTRERNKEWDKERDML